MEVIKSVFRPDFTWPQPMKPTISKTTPALPSRPGKLRQRVWGLLHTCLSHFSKWYTRWYGVYSEPHVYQLPFGLILKWSDRTSEEEAVAMQMARAAGMPVPMVLSYGWHPGCSYNRFWSILMTRLPGFTLANSSDPLDVEVEEPWLSELRDCIDSMRQWTSPYDASICSPMGTSIRSSRVPDHIMGPFPTEAELHDFLLSPASGHGFDSTQEYIDALAQANEIRKMPHRITFTHGDFKAHNIMVGDDNQLTGILDWESGGWMPEYWEYTTALRFGRRSWWGEVVTWLGGDKYSQQLTCDIALNSLTVDSYIAF
ncbi:hypothetical protein N7468_002984 [Penicillium chermesinum]|uniref:Aminoglycoside phosphotransferase domain-containing protein n=1 Tax=Penicillium chermesinum TaxID=63820 RepID=A0A9W9P671_9EURO|nr:uncharacterized protein N7468_002984 [Penicillium chermesinum]KAJ5238365.1 hypothetical protein N7468_002984 [Penicillium chermesinum]KAJ6164032.1 hypothetical protein N7470_002704 [Penicillium chermesinum]